MCDTAVDDSIATLKLIPDWFVTIKMIKKLVCCWFPNLLSISRFYK